MQSSESRHVIKMVEDDTSSLLWVRDTEAYSCYTRKSVLTENSVMLDTVFDFDREIFRSRAYQVAARSNMKQVVRNRERTNLQHKVLRSTSEISLANFINLDDDDQDTQTIKGEPPNSSQPLGNMNEAQTSDESRLSLDLAAEVNLALQCLRATDNTVTNVAYDNGLNSRAEDMDDIPENTSPNLALSASEGTLPHIRTLISPLDERRLTYSEKSMHIIVTVIFSFSSTPTDTSQNAEESLMEIKKTPRSPWGLSNVLKYRGIQQAREKAQIATISRAEKQGKGRNGYIARPLTQYQRCGDREHKVLLLGTSESGKSTVFKSLKILLEGPSNLTERKSFKENIFSDMTQSMRHILKEMENLKMLLNDQKTKDRVQTIFMQPEDTESLSSEVADAIKALWKDGGVLECFRRSRKYWLMDNAE